MNLCPCCGGTIKNVTARVDLDFNVLLAEDKVVELENREAEMLHVLLKASPRLVTYDTLIMKVWGLNEPYDANNTIKTYRCKLMRKLQQNKICSFTIKRIWARGYALVPVQS